jgi:predicted regulator of Ras-like GTPase activity (Roadblock/LC7/MglB family)
VSVFGQELRRVAAKVPEMCAVMIIGSDGIQVEKVVVRPQPNLDALAAELTTLLRRSLGVAADTGLGDLQELTLLTEGVVAVIRAITPEYFIFAALAPGALVGRARLALRVACLTLASEFA